MTLCICLPERLCLTRVTAEAPKPTGCFSLFLGQSGSVKWNTKGEVVIYNIASQSTLREWQRRGVLEGE